MDDLQFHDVEGGLFDLGMSPVMDEYTVAFEFYSELALNTSRLATDETLDPETFELNF